MWVQALGPVRALAKVLGLAWVQVQGSVQALGSAREPEPERGLAQEPVRGPE